MTANTSTTQFLCNIPILCVSNLLRSRDFYVKKLGFEIDFEWGTPTFFIGIKRGEVNLHLSDEQHSSQPAGMSNVNIITNEVDDYFSQCQQLGVDIVIEPNDRDYGMRDFGIKDIDGNILNFGCSITKT